ncbi:hypothetical protein AAHH79_42530, partial [Burkholderia pseudomallei]
MATCTSVSVALNPVFETLAHVVDTVSPVVTMFVPFSEVLTPVRMVDVHFSVTRFTSFDDALPLSCDWGSG